MSTILIIEDDKKINSLLNRILNKSGFETVCADNGFDGLSLALNNDYSLILMDLITSASNRRRSAARIKKVEKHSRNCTFS